MKEPEASVNVAMAPFRHGAEVVCWCWWGEVLPPIQQGRFFWAICMSLCNLMSLGAPTDFRIVLSKVHIGEDGGTGGGGQFCRHKPPIRALIAIFLQGPNNRVDETSAELLERLKRVCILSRP